MQPVGRSVDDDGFLLVGEEGGPISATGAKAGRPIALDARKFCFQRFYRWAREIGRGSMTPKVRYWVAPEEIGLISDDTFLPRSEEHTSALQSLMRISYAVFCLKKKTSSYTQ